MFATPPVLLSGQGCRLLDLAELRALYGVALSQPTLPNALPPTNPTPYAFSHPFVPSTVPYALAPSSFFILALCLGARSSSLLLSHGAGGRPGPARQAARQELVRVLLQPGLHGLVASVEHVLTALPGDAQLLQLPLLVPAPPDPLARHGAVHPPPILREARHRASLLCALPALPQTT
ncbi:hypothetical protein FIBSPDRAFT_964352 [Athelia psychrophila]|uniref:Uncharacterized protein n=1 Tax=Athelia psychrophila TaxID=1759441 RepID=A0A165XUE4_9AGAM|nr:hypothetical protein FIBSPDRAFT_964352 [Fibularhizoctonia sp. CBS 109695]